MTAILIPMPKTPPLDPATGNFTREWYRYFALLQQAVGGSTTIITDIDISGQPGIDGESGQLQTEAMEAWGQASANAGEIEQLRNSAEGLSWQSPGPVESAEALHALDGLTPFGMPPTEMGALEAAKNTAYRIVEAGAAVLVGGTVTVNTVNADSANQFFLTAKVLGGTQGFLRVGTVTANTSFVINSSNGADTSTVSWCILKAIA